jgi:hypothetical protein
VAINDVTPIALGECQVVVIPVLSDAMSADSFRHLSIACRWIIRQDTSPHPKGIR